MQIPSRVAARLTAGLKKFQPIMAAAQLRDVNESDTVVIVTDLLHELFGYDKYSEITSEQMIRGTYCDLTINLDGTLAVIVEVKAIGLTLKDQHVKQAVDYAANQGCEWVALTTGAHWRVYRVQFTKPIATELIVEFDLLELDPRNADHLELLWLLAKEGWRKAGLDEYAAQRQALSRFSIAAVVLSDPVMDVIRRELRRITPDVHIDTSDIEKVLREQVLKREVLEGEKAVAAGSFAAKAAHRALRSTRAEDEVSPEPEGSESNEAPTSGST